MKTLSISVPDKYYTAIDELAEEKNTTKSEIFRNFNGLNEAEFNITFSAKEKPLLRYVQTLLIILAGLIDLCYENIQFWDTKQRKNYKAKKAFYTFIYKQMSSFYNYLDKVILTSCERGFEEISDKSVTDQADNVEAIAYLLEKGNADDWAKVRNIASKYQFSYKRTV